MAGVDEVVTVYRECPWREKHGADWDDCGSEESRKVDALLTDDIVLRRADRARIAAFRAFAERGLPPQSLSPSTMPVRLTDGPMPWAFYESLPCADDSFVGITLRVPLEGRDRESSRLELCDYAIYACVSDAPVRGAWRFHFAGIEPAKTQLDALFGSANGDG
ncbi:hypothetical protein [Microbacterium hominis]|uniref:Uncharacterized protein n=1 Tax=Microbacterium hominis TaxID=162426 RepID=A0A7D4TPV4_9MICO|nr:hypothetical protein [Microbacterium hominis]QKJ18584.1 hypothetical protein HQM25_03745 [Microbacterium hominis]